MNTDIEICLDRVLTGAAWLTAAALLGVGWIFGSARLDQLSVIAFILAATLHVVTEIGRQNRRTQALLRTMYADQLQAQSADPGLRSMR